VGPVRTGGARQGSAVALVRSGERLLAYVADGDSRSIHTIDVDAAHELVRTRVDGEPRQILVLADGRVVVSLSDGRRVAVLEPAGGPDAPLAPVCARDVAAEPWGLAASADGATVVVTSAWGSALSVLDGRTLDVKRVLPLRRDPRDVLIDDHGVAFVEHLVGAKMTTLDLGKEDDDPELVELGVRKSTPLAQQADAFVQRTGSQGYALASLTLTGPDGRPGPSRVFAPMVSVDPGDLERRSAIYYGPPFDGVAKQTPIVNVVDAEERQALDEYVLGTSEKPFARECLLPRAAATRPSTRSLLVACRGIDQVLELDALAVDPFRAERRRFDVPPGPEGMAVDDVSGRAVVFSQIGATVTVLPLDPKAGYVRHVALDYHPDPALAAASRGRMLFYRTDDARISDDGLGCSSCHIDGRDDGLTWSTPMGPRQTPMLAGRLDGTAPYGWEGDRSTLAEYISNTVTRLGGSGLDPEALDDLSRFLLVAKAAPASAGRGALAARGKALFEDPVQACSSCHLAGATDARTHGLVPNAHDSQSAFDTPSLHFIAGTAPYFHDGRYPTLEALLADPKSQMGHGASLPVADRAALAAYLRTL
jgi:mono/diheme cytochrome c family protein